MEKLGGSKEASGPPPPLPPPPPTIPPNVKLEQVTTTKYTITSRCGVLLAKVYQGHLLAKVLKDLFKYFGTYSDIFPRH